MVLEMSSENTKYLLAGYYAGVAFALLMAVLVMVTVKRRILQDACGIVAFVLCMVLACLLLIGFYIFGEHEIILAINHVVYNTGIFLYFFLNYRDRDYHLYVLPYYPCNGLCQRVLLSCIIVTDLTICPLWVVKSLYKLTWHTPHSYTILCGMGIMYLCYMLLYLLHTWTLVHTQYENNPFQLNRCMSYLTFVYLLCILVGYCALVISTSFPQDAPPSPLFPGLIYVVADTEFYLAVLFYVFTHTRVLPDRLASYRHLERIHDPSSSSH